MSTLTPTRFVILAALDGSPASEAVVTIAARLSLCTGAELHLLHVIDSLFEADRAMLGETDSDRHERHQKHLDRAVRELADLGVPHPPEHLLEGASEDVILMVAATLQADLILVGTHERKGLNRLLVGSVSEAVMRHAHCPVMVVRPKHYQAP
jgi:nucleotide-binding universal stress UspA family protein